MDIREGKDETTINTAVGAILLKLADPSPSSLVAWLVPYVPTLLTQGPSIAAFLQRKQRMVSRLLL
jgi:hypothetical protein